ncbi:MAG: hypothetical protein IKJ77_07550 [Firmicutes bacterium]|nr:hypothetical protein [Bacillota bacterium]
MKKNKMMRLASCLLVAVLLTTSMISGTFAKYTTTVSSEDAARVAYWGFQASNSMDIKALFTDKYTNVDSVDDKDVIAPGTSGSKTFAFAWDEEVSAYGAQVAVTGPEVAYNFTVAVEDTCDPLIKDNKNIQWKLDDGAWGTWDQLVASIKALSGEEDGSKDYDPNTLPVAFTKNDDTHTIAWQWNFGGTENYTVDGKPLTQDEYDTYMGNAAELDDCSIKITITATQVD